MQCNHLFLVSDYYRCINCRLYLNKWCTKCDYCENCFELETNSFKIQHPKEIREVKEKYKEYNQMIFNYLGLFKLPELIWRKIFSYLDDTSSLNFKLVCSHFELLKWRSVKKLEIASKYKITAHEVFIFILFLFLFLFYFYFYFYFVFIFILFYFYFIFIFFDLI